MSASEAAGLRPFTLVTGASSGIGAETARRLSSKCGVILHGRDRHRLEATRAKFANPDAHGVWIADLTNIGDIAASLGSALEAAAGQVEAYVHCAGIFDIRPFRTTTLEHAIQLMNVNFLAAAEIVRFLLSRRNNGMALSRVVFVSSTASRFGAKGLSMYSASKGALDSLMRSLAVELAPRVRINSVLPGAVSTRMTQDLFGNQETAARMSDQYPLWPGSADDVAGVIEFLLSDAARWITGQQIIVDGGRTINITA